MWRHRSVCELTAIRLEAWGTDLSATTSSLRLHAHTTYSVYQTSYPTGIGVLSSELKRLGMKLITHYNPMLVL